MQVTVALTLLGFAFAANAVFLWRIRSDPTGVSRVLRRHPRAAILRRIVGAERVHWILRNVLPGLSLVLWLLLVAWVCTCS